MNLCDFDTSEYNNPYMIFTVCSNCEYYNQFGEGYGDCDLWLDENGNNVQVCGVNWCNAGMLFIPRERVLNVSKKRRSKNKFIKKLNILYYDRGDKKHWEETQRIREETKVDGFSKREKWLNKYQEPSGDIDKYLDIVVFTKDKRILFSGFFAYYLHMTRGFLVDVVEHIIMKEGIELDEKVFKFDGIYWEEYNRYMDRERRNSRAQDGFKESVF